MTGSSARAERVSPPTKNVWNVARAWAFVRDVPETGVIFALCGGAVALAVHAFYRGYYLHGETFMNKELRSDPEKQLTWRETQKPSFYYYLAQTKVDDDGYNVGIFNNRAAPFMYNPAPGQQIYGHSGLKPQWPYGFARTDVELGRHGEPKDTEPHPERFLPEEKRADALLRAQQQQKQRGASPAAAAH